MFLRTENRLDEIERVDDDVGQKRIDVVNGKWVTKPSSAELGQ